MIKLPHPFSSFPREQLLYSHYPPIEPLLRLSKELNQHLDKESSTNFWIKREDSNSGLAFGGNKIRKLEYVIPDALKSGATILVTTGGLQSNHMRQVAAAAARYGLKVGSP
jgi:1-aminocyclopropane-1-carboxylate deaminase